jgi:Zn-dependent M28 family amino/carboxypeptidase
MKSRFFASIAVFSAFVLASCQGNDNPATTTSENTKSDIVIPDSLPGFNADSAFEFTRKQVSFGPRVPNSPAHIQCGDYLISTLKRLGAQVDVQATSVTAHTGESLRIRNIIGRIHPEKNRRIYLSAHWDTRPFADRDPDHSKERFDGAVDGASGAGILLEIARLVSARMPEIGVDIVLFDAEDYGNPDESSSYCLGSQYFASHLPAYFKPEFGILLDMAAAPGATFYREGYSMQYAPAIVSKVWAIAGKLGYRSFFVNENSSPVTDDHFFMNSIAGIPTIDIIHHDAFSRTGFGSYWHTKQDNMEAVDKGTMQAVGHTLIAMIYSEKAEKSKASP